MLFLVNKDYAGSVSKKEKEKSSHLYVPLQHVIKVRCCTWPVESSVSIFSAVVPNPVRILLSTSILYFVLISEKKKKMIWQRSHQKLNYIRYLDATWNHFLSILMFYLNKNCLLRLLVSSKQGTESVFLELFSLLWRQPPLPVFFILSCSVEMLGFFSHILSSVWLCADLY